MQLSLNIINDALSDLRPSIRVLDTSSKVSSVSIYNKRKKSFSPEHIYVGMLSDLLANEPSSPGVFFVAIPDKKKPSDIPDGHLMNAIVLEKECEMLDVFELLQATFSDISTWCEGMDFFLIRKKSIQDVLNLCEQIIGNYITITDSSFSLVAYTNSLKCDCPHTNDLVRHGYYNQDAIAKFNALRLPEFWKDANDIYIDDSLAIAAYPTISKVIHYNNAYFAHVVMLCDKKPPTPGLVDMFKILIDHLMVCFERQWVENNQMPHVYDSLILSLIEGNGPGPDTINERAKASGLPAEANFRLLKISADGSGGVMLQRLSQELQDHIPEAKVTLSKSNLIVLIVQNIKHKNRFDQIIEMLQEILDHYRAKCGVSDPFTNLTDLNLAGIQANVALQYGYRSTYPYFASITAKKYPRVYTYESSYPRYLLTATPESEKISKSNAAFNTLSELYRYDQEHNTNNLELLYVYLINDRKATETAEITHMHRNNVIYRISRISEMADLDLDDPQVRFRLLLAYELFTV
ncbi:MAG: helix-turn-helix domain-containing protein [Firmicutes bacterium]|nr:helix-turn-helix domain-containing protein [Bacillota bacterium]MBR0480968.1 helix-turn-helix domain-containing protein [Bacillota bacterium]